MSDTKKLMQERKRLTAILPLLDSGRRGAVEERLKRIDAKLGRPKAGIGTLAEQAAGIDGVGGLRFEARSVPGQGRLIRIPFILRAFNANQAPDIVIPAPPDGPALPVGPKLITDAGTNVPAINSATVIATIPTLTGVNVLKEMFFETPVLEWVKYRVVGFQASASAAPQYTPTPATPLPAPGVDYPSATYYAIPSPVPFLLVRNLNMGGSANLFPNNGFVDAAYYNGTLPYFTGLRDYPVVDRTNRMLVEAAVSGAQASSLTFALWVVGEVLTDQFYADPTPGPYAQEGALKRAKPKRQEGFVR
jgi:hypothetical protein